MLKKAKGQKAKFYSYHSKNHIHVSGYGLLRKETSISLRNLKLYVPALVKEGLVKFEANGDVTLLGNECCKKKYKSDKMVPINVADSVFKTVYHVVGIRVFTSARNQVKEIARKQEISVQTQKLTNPANHEEYKEAKLYLRRKGRMKTKLSPDIVLSNLGYSKLRILGNGQIKETVSSGQYWKSKLKQIGLIETERRFNKVRRIDYNEFVFGKSRQLIERNCVFKDGFMQQERASYLKITTVQM